MAFKPFYDKQGDVPTEFREHYVEQDGKFVLDTDFKSLGYENVAATGGLREANERLKKERNTFREESKALAKLKKFEPLLEVDDFDPDDVESLIARAKAGGASDEAIEAATRPLQKKLDDLAADKEKAEQEKAAAQKEKDDYIVEGELRRAAINAGVSKTMLDDVVALNRSKVKIVDGKVAYVDKDGDPTSSPEDYFSGEYKKAKPNFYDPDGKGGSGESSTSGGTGGAAKTSFQEAKTTDEKVEALRQKRLAAGKDA